MPIKQLLTRAIILAALIAAMGLIYLAAILAELGHDADLLRTGCGQVFSVCGGYRQ